MICIGTGILFIVGAVVGVVYIFHDTMKDWMHPMAGLGIIFGCAYGLITGLLGIISILIGLLLRK